MRIAYALLAAIGLLPATTSGPFTLSHLRTLAPSHSSQPLPTPAQSAWHDLELGMFIHLAPQTWQDTESDTLATPLADINPDKLDTDQWVRVAESMGAKYIVFVAKHEGGFCWWQTDTTDFGVKNTPWRAGKGDVMADLAASCKKRSIGLGVYLSPQDRKHGVGVGGKANDQTKRADYERLFRTQLTELLTRYGPMMEVWFDGSLVFDVGDILTAHAPDAVVFQGPQASIRWVGNEDGIAPYPAWNSVKFGAKPWGNYTAEDGVPPGSGGDEVGRGGGGGGGGGGSAEYRWLPNECDARIRSTWFWKTNNEDTLKSLDQLMDMYYRSVGHGAVLLLNNTPDRSGLIPEPDARRSAEFGAEIKRRFGAPAASTSGTGRELIMMLFTSVTIDHAVIMEDITQGERVRKYVVEALVGDSWRELSADTAVGHKKIDRFEPVEVSQVRLRITDSAGEPQIRSFAIYRATGR